MSFIPSHIRHALGALITNSASILALGSFVVYLLGYLIVRFHLTVFGIATDINVVDERYLFAGAKFLVYLFSIIPILLLILVTGTVIVFLIVATIQLIYFVLHKLKPQRFRAKRRLSRKTWRKMLFTFARPHFIFRRVPAAALASALIVFSVLFIQLVLRQCFLLSEMLLGNTSDRRHWLTLILTNVSGNYQYYYFTLLFSGFLLSLGMYMILRHKRETRRMPALVRIAEVLLVIEFIFLPINYGILVYDKAVPRVKAIGNQLELVECGNDCNACNQAWLVWEGTKEETYLIRTWDKGQESKALVSLPRDKVELKEIVSYDNVLNILLNVKGCRYE